MAGTSLTPELLLWITQLSQSLHARVAARLLPLIGGILFARGRRTVACWLRAAGINSDYKAYYYFLGSLGRKTEWVFVKLLRVAFQVVSPGDRLLFAIDDTPTKRYGPQVEGAGIHHNPTPGPAAQKFLYGHVWVTLALVVRHPLWGAIALPLRALMYIRQVDLPKLPASYRPTFRTKLEQAADLVRWLIVWLDKAGKRVWIVTDGGYAKKPVLKEVKRQGATFVGRLRKDAQLWSVPVAKTKPTRGRPAIYGKQRLHLAKRAAHRGGWQSDDFQLYNRTVTTQYKTFLATYKPAGGLVRVVIAKDEHGWRAFFCTDPDATVAEILEAVADRSALEQTFHDIKEVHGAGQQQLRNYWANVAAYHLNLWWYTLVELWAWRRPHRELCDRSDRPWDDAERRPSHADKRNALRRQSLESEYRAAAAHGSMTRKCQTLVRRLLRLAA